MNKNWSLVRGVAPAAFATLISPALLWHLFGNIFAAAIVVLPSLVLAYILLYRIARSERLGLSLALDVLSLLTSLLMLLLLFVSLFPFDEGNGFQPSTYLLTFSFVLLGLGVIAGVPTLILSSIDLKRVVQMLRPPKQPTQAVEVPPPVVTGEEQLKP